jgi:dTDP-4-dehydrorhamnose 3,5-epimerase
MINFREGEIKGVIIENLNKFSDERGYLVETFREDNLPGKLRPVMSYVSFTKPGAARGPHEHIKQIDIFVFLGPGDFKIRLWDNRKNGKTYSSFMEITGGRDNPILIIIPPGIVHGYKNISEELGMVINHPDKLHKGWSKKEEVDEIRHEDAEDNFYLDFVSEDN